MVWYTALVLWYNRKLVAFLPFGESSAWVGSSIQQLYQQSRNQQHVLFLMYTQRSLALATIFQIHLHCYFHFSLYTFHFNFTFTRQISHDMIALKPESCSSSLFNFHCLLSPSSSSCSPYKTHIWGISSEMKDLSDMCIEYLALFYWLVLLLHQVTYSL